MTLAEPVVPADGRMPSDVASDHAVPAGECVRATSTAATGADAMSERARLGLPMRERTAL
jgi:hypothetical protein